ncbi:MAG: ornithine carbamoyltransferase [Proteobacteria bacterium]|nr:ornithine carbamoyltransferase [Pseudomonadota bacterium]
MKKDFLSLFDWSKEEMDEFLASAKALKEDQKKGTSRSSLRGKTIGMIFDKPSTRTRVSFEAGMAQLGGQSIFLSGGELQLSRGETIADTARVMSRYVDGVVIRTFSHKMVEDFAHHAEVPVINGLTDLLHPCQILSDLFTLTEKRGQYKNLSIVYVGDGNNVANSWINAAARLGFALTLACPEGYQPNKGILARAFQQEGSKIRLIEDPGEAVRGADVIYTDVWASMGQEAEAGKRADIFGPFQVNQQLVKKADKKVLVMHCLPAHRGDEITDEVIDGPHAIVWDQAENRLHVQKAILERLLKQKP